MTDATHTEISNEIKRRMGLYLREGVTLLMKVTKGSAQFNATGEVNRRGCLRGISIETHQDVGRHPDGNRFDKLRPLRHTPCSAVDPDGPASTNVCSPGFKYTLDDCAWSAPRCEMEHSKMLSVGTVDDRAGQTRLPDGGIEDNFEALLEAMDKQLIAQYRVAENRRDCFDL